MPLAPRQRWRWLLLAGACAVVVALLWLPLPARGRVYDAMTDLAHAPLFAGFTLLLVGLWPRSQALLPASRVWAIGLGVTAFGALIEFTQPAFGRSLSWHDGLANGLGALGAVLLVMALRTPLRNRRLAGIALAAAAWIGASFQPGLIFADAVRQSWQLPELSSFEDELELSRWLFHECQGRRSEEHVTDGRYSACVEIDGGNYPGALMIWPPRDWSAYDEVVLDVYLDAPQPVAAVLRVHDHWHIWQHWDRYQNPIELRPGANELRISLADLEHAPEGRKMDLARVRLLQLYLLHPHQPLRLYLDHVRLVTEGQSPVAGPRVPRRARESTYQLP